MSAQVDPRRADLSRVDRKYYYRRSLTMRELLPALGAAAGAAAVSFYLVKLFLERTPLERESVSPSAPRPVAQGSGRFLAKHIGQR
jgi:hypothetical protein